MPPELPTPQEEREIARITETDIDFAVEQKHTKEILKCMVCEAGELDADGYCLECGAKTEC